MFVARKEFLDVDLNKKEEEFVKNARLDSVNSDLSLISLPLLLLSQSNPEGQVVAADGRSSAFNYKNEIKMPKRYRKG